MQRGWKKRARWEPAEKPAGACGGGGADEVHPHVSVAYLRLRDADDAPGDDAGGGARDVENPLDKKAG